MSTVHETTLSTQERIKELMQRHILVKDAAIGTTLTGTRRDIVPDTLSISDRERVVAMYEASIKAGATIITSNPFMSDPLMLASCGVDTPTEEVTDEPKKKGCRSTLSVSAGILAAAVMGAVCLKRKRRTKV